MTSVALGSFYERRGGSLKEIALVYARLGEIDRAFEYLGRVL